MKLKHSINLKSDDVLSSKELKAIIGGAWTSSCACGYFKRTGAYSEVKITLVRESNISQLECSKKCYEKCNNDENCNTNILRITFIEQGSGSPSGS